MLKYRIQYNAKEWRGAPLCCAGRMLIDAVDRTADRVRGGEEETAGERSSC